MGCSASKQVCALAATDADIDHVCLPGTRRACSVVAGLQEHNSSTQNEECFHFSCSAAEYSVTAKHPNKVQLARLSVVVDCTSVSTLQGLACQQQQLHTSCAEVSTPCAASADSTASTPAFKSMMEIRKRNSNVVGKAPAGPDSSCTSQH